MRRDITTDVRWEMKGFLLTRKSMKNSDEIYSMSKECSAKGMFLFELSSHRTQEYVVRKGIFGAFFSLFQNMVYLFTTIHVRENGLR